MKDFIKIFLGLTALVAAFLVGRNYGEKTYLEGPAHRDIIRATEELNFAKADFENAKIKLQNITDQAETLKTEELLAQILHVFLTDLGLRIQNKDVIIRRAAQTDPMIEPRLKEGVTTEPFAAPAKYPEPTPPKKTIEWSKSKINKLKSSEWMVQNSSDARAALKNLKKVQLINLNSWLNQAEYLDLQECTEYLGSYRGNIKHIEDKNFGSLELELKVNPAEELFGKVAWYKDGSAVSEKLNNCGKKIKNLSGRIFNLSTDKYLQIYKLISSGELAGNFYQVSPNGTTTLIGSFVLRRVDKF